MPLTLLYKGFNYVSYYNGGYENADSLPALADTGANSASLNLEYGIDVNNSTVYADANYTDSLTALANTIQQANGLGLSVMVRPLIDFLDPSKIGSYQPSDWRSYYNPTDPAAFFASYKTMIVQDAEVAQANGAAMLSIGTELDQLTGATYLPYWTDIISSVRAVFTGKLTYSADWDTDLSPWQGQHGLTAGTGNLATQVSFWNQLDYVGIDCYAPLSDAANPTLANLIAGWTQVPTDSVSRAVTGNQSLISYFDGVAAQLGKPLFFTELGYESATDAAREPAGSSTNVFDPSLQANLYQAFFDAWQQDDNGSLAGLEFWNWDPNVAEVGPGNGANFSPQGLAAQTVVETNFAACYCEGTLIQTADGAVPVERLAIGDRVMTMSGAARPVKWIGRRSYSGRFALGRAHILPICIKAGALADGQPGRDLWVSPHHAMYLDGALIEARYLVNGVTIVQATAVEQVRYFHIELETHDVIIAEGALSETFLNDNSRGLFHNAHEYNVLYPVDVWSRTARYCAPRPEDGYEVEAVRQRIAARAGLQRGAAARRA